MAWDYVTKLSRMQRVGALGKEVLQLYKQRLRHTRCVYYVDGDYLALIPMSKRINIVLPETTIRTIDRMAPPGQRSRFIDQAVQHFVANRSAEALRAQLEHAAVRDRDLDREIAADWFAVDQESWQRLESS